MTLWAGPFSDLYVFCLRTGAVPAAVAPLVGVSFGLRCCRFAAGAPPRCGDQLTTGALPDVALRNIFSRSMYDGGAHNAVADETVRGGGEQAACLREIAA